MCVVDNLTTARRLEASIKADMLRQEFDVKAHEVQEVPLTLSEQRQVPFLSKRHLQRDRDGWRPVPEL